MEAMDVKLTNFTLFLLEAIDTYVPESLRPNIVTATKANLGTPELRREWFYGKLPMLCQLPQVAAPVLKIRTIFERNTKEDNEKMLLEMVAFIRAVSEEIAKSAQSIEENKTQALQDAWKLSGYLTLFTEMYFSQPIAEVQKPPSSSI